MDTTCVSVCPVDCIHGPIDITGSGAEVEKQGRSAFPGGQLYIDPSTCIDCGACISVCPPDAIYEDEYATIKAGDEDSVHNNYKFFGQEYDQNH
jgi:ferredoxin